MTLKAAPSLRKIARELAWRVARYQWRFLVAHVTTEMNTVADALSRLEDDSLTPELQAFLAGAARKAVPNATSLFVVDIE